MGKANLRSCFASMLIKLSSEFFARIISLLPKTRCIYNENSFKYNACLENKSMSAHRKNSVLAIVLVFVLINVYLNIPLALTSTFYIPGVFVVLSIPVLLLVHRNHLSGSDYRFLMSLLVVFVLSALLSPRFDLISKKLFSGAFQIMVSITAGILVAKSIVFIEKIKIKRILLTLSLLLLIGTLLENVGLLRDLSDGFRMVVFTQEGAGYQAYDSVDRDTGLSGGIRPKFFTSEPSLLAIGFFVFSISWLVLEATLARWWIFLAANFCMLYLVTSPIIVISIIASLFVMAHSGRNRNIFIPLVLVSLGVVFAALMSAIAGVDYADFNIVNRFISMIDDSGSYRVTSSNMRIVFPFITMVDVLGASPLFGVGIGGNETVLDFTSLPFDEMNYVLGNNSLALIFINLGMIGGAAFIFFFYRYSENILGRSSSALFCILAILLMQTMGGFVSPMFWGYLFVLFGVIHRSCKQ